MPNKMATLNISLAWSIPVAVEILGAHLQAYVQLQPTINALRLCNRYGKGDQAAVTKLPAELVAEIEGHLVEAERKVQRKNWRTDFACFQGLCKPIDHLSDSEQVEIWCDVYASEPGCCLGDCSDCESMCSRTTLPKKLKGAQKEELAEFLDQCLADDGPEESSWWIEHENRSARWEGKTGSPKGPDRGLLSTYAMTLSRSFGLELWVTHTQPAEGKEGQFTACDVFASTIAYITLPCGKTTSEFDCGFSERGSYMGESPFIATESGGGMPVALPRRLSKSEAHRFRRAFKVLGLKAKAFEEPKTALSASTDDQKSVIAPGEASTAESDAPSKKAKGISKAPKLRVLYSHAAGPDF